MTVIYERPLLEQWFSSLMALLSKGFGKYDDV